MGVCNKVVAVVVVSLMSILTGSACTRTETPSCTDEKVKTAVLDKAREISRDILVVQGSMESFRPPQVKGAYQALKEGTEKAGEPHREQIRTLLSDADKSMQRLDLVLSDVRPLKTKSENGVSACGGSILFINKESKKQNPTLVEFIAQYNEDRSVRIEMTKF